MFYMAIPSGTILRTSLSTGHVSSEALAGRTSVSFRARYQRFLVWHCFVMLPMCFDVVLLNAESL